MEKRRVHCHKLLYKTHKPQKSRNIHAVELTIIQNSHIKKKKKKKGEIIPKKKKFIFINIYGETRSTPSKNKITVKKKK